MKYSNKMIIGNMLVLSLMTISLITYSTMVLVDHQAQSDDNTSNALSIVRHISKELRSGHVYNPCIVMVGQLNAKQGDEHYEDLLTTIQMNLLNPFICEYHFLQVDNHHNLEIKSLLNAHEKVKIKIIGKELTIGNFMEYANENASFRYVMFSNGHVFFDHSLIHVSKLRQESIMTISTEHEHIDAIIFKTLIPFSSKLIESFLDTSVHQETVKKLISRYNQMVPSRITSWNLFN